MGVGASAFFQVFFCIFCNALGEKTGWAAGLVVVAATATTAVAAIAAQL